METGEVVGVFQLRRAAENVALRQAEIETVIVHARDGDERAQRALGRQEALGHLGASPVVVDEEHGVEDRAGDVDIGVGDGGVVDGLPAGHGRYAGQDANHLGVRQRDLDRLVERKLLGLHVRRGRVGNCFRRRQGREGRLGKLGIVANIQGPLFGHDQ